MNVYLYSYYRFEEELELLCANYCWIYLYTHYGHNEKQIYKLRWKKSYITGIRSGNV